MKYICRTLFIAATLAALPFAPTQAADKTTVVKFKPQTTSATIKGNLKGYDTNNYMLGANAGQVLKVVLKASNSSCYFNIQGPDSEEAQFNGSMTMGDFSGTLTVDGNYKAMVYLMRNAARRNEICKYTITFEIDG
ncbi:hypothetical protein JJB09_02730 [Rhizobium sp. KVB221]|uniref:DNA breaking-rejoining protein n=1 Tax=Rhizobium setariae TaxID=2801340 RepID=A0A936YIU9_9HYPH|nr:hypothetical protein [Rhizobium setariae]MBL0370933.1 hypothetical protein [Rhizobium setariae]